MVHDGNVQRITLGNLSNKKDRKVRDQISEWNFENYRQFGHHWCIGLLWRMQGALWSKFPQLINGVFGPSTWLLLLEIRCLLHFIVSKGFRFVQASRFADCTHLIQCTHSRCVTLFVCMDNCLGTDFKLYFSSLQTFPRDISMSHALDDDVFDMLWVPCEPQDFLNLSSKRWRFFLSMLAQC